MVGLLCSEYAPRFACAVKFLVTQDSHDNARHGFRNHLNGHLTALDNEGESEGILTPLKSLLDPFTLAAELPATWTLWARYEAVRVLSGGLSGKIFVARVR